MTVSSTTRSCTATTGTRPPLSTPSCSASRRPTAYGPFLVVQLDNQRLAGLPPRPARGAPAALRVPRVRGRVRDEIFGRIQERGLEYWADPFQQAARARSTTNDGGRGVYWEDPNGHNLEIITRPYGSGG